VIPLAKTAGGNAQFRSLFDYRGLVKGDLYVFEVCPECIGGREIDLRRRVFACVGGRAWFVCAAIGERRFFTPAGLGGDLGQEAAGGITFL
jgi:hypothetical protein